VKQARRPYARARVGGSIAAKRAPHPRAVAVAGKAAGVKQARRRASPPRTRKAKAVRHARSMRVIPDSARQDLAKRARRLLRVCVGKATAVVALDEQAVSRFAPEAPRRTLLTGGDCRHALPYARSARAQGGVALHVLRARDSSSAAERASAAGSGVPGRRDTCAATGEVAMPEPAARRGAVRLPGHVRRVLPSARADHPARDGTLCVLPARAAAVRVEPVGRSAPAGADRHAARSDLSRSFGHGRRQFRWQLTIGSLSRSDRCSRR
jgi:hypothetical protein